ncbi:MAG: glycosyltransferase family 9 protein [Rikenellaceae bacterium]
MDQNSRTETVGSTSSSQRQLPRHLLFIRLSAMGDVAMLPHAIRSLRASYPDVKISILTRPLFRCFFDGLDVEFVDVDLNGRHRGVRGIFRLAREIAKFGVDAVADTHGVLRSQLLSLFLKFRGVTKRAQINKGRAQKKGCIGHGVDSTAAPLKHTVVRYCDVIRALGFQIEDPQPAVKPQLVNPLGEKQGRWIGVAPFSAHRGKCYPLDQCRELIGLLSAEYDTVFVHSGGGDELAFAEEMEAQYPNARATFSRVKLREEMALISHLDAVVSMDSLVMHMASLVATPVVSVWGATHPITGFLGYGCDPELTVQNNTLTCRPCSVYGNKPCKFENYRCMTSITAAQIAECCARLHR